MTSTLPDILPSIGLAASPRFHPAIWPMTAHSDDDGRLCVGEVPLTDIADEFGTPTYVIDEADFRSRARSYRAALGDTEVLYAGKSLLTIAVARWAHEEGLGIDVCSAGELAIAMAGGVEKARIVMHGNAKSQDDLRAAVRFGIGRIVLDSTIEITDLAGMAEGRQRVLIRVTPDLDIHGHRAVTTGISDQKFGFTLDGGHAADAVARVLSHPSLRLIGLHCHLGSQVTDAAIYGEAIRRMIAAMADVRARHGVVLTELNIGGGHGIPYLAGDPELSVDELARVIGDALDDGVCRRTIPAPDRRRRTRPGHQRARRCHRLPGARRQDTTGRTHLRSRRRWDERQPAGVAIRGEIHRRACQSPFSRAQATGHRRGPALRIGRRDRPRRRAPRRRASGRPARGGLHRGLPPQHGVELQHGRSAADSLRSRTVGPANWSAAKRPRTCCPAIGARPAIRPAGAGRLPDGSGRSTSG